MKMIFAVFSWLCTAVLSNSIAASLYDVPIPYSFRWEVTDTKSYNDYGHQEISDGRVVVGSYYVLLPDGRKQIVDYKADEYGYVADVRFHESSAYSGPSSYVPPLTKEPTYGNILIPGHVYAKSIYRKIKPDRVETYEPIAIEPVKASHSRPDLIETPITFDDVSYFKKDHSKPPVSVSRLSYKVKSDYIKSY